MAEVKYTKEGAPLPTPNSFPSNSYKSKTEPPKPTKVIKGNVVQKKKSFGRKLVDIFISEDVGDVKTYILYDILVPALKNALADAIGGGADMLLGTTSNRRKTSYSTGSKTPYGTFYKGANTTTRAEAVVGRTGYAYDDIILESRGEAMDVLDTLVNYIQEYGAVRLSDLQEMVGVTGQFTDTYWGWTNLSTATVRKVREGYLLDLPKIENLR